MVTFKSVGTALQDLALAARLHEMLGRKAARAPGLASLKRPVGAGRGRGSREKLRGTT